MLEITTRQSLVSLFKSRPHLRADLIQYLNDIEDAARIVQRFLVGRGDPGDLLGICDTIKVWTSIRDRILLERNMEGQHSSELGSEWASLDSLISRITDLSDLSRTIDLALARKEYENISMDEESVLTSEDHEATMLSPAPGVQGSWTIKPG